MRARAVQLGDGDLYVAGGVESMTRAPYVLSKASKPFARDVELFDTSLGWRFVNPEDARDVRHRLDGPDRGERRRAVRCQPRGSGRVRAAVAAEGGGRPQRGPLRRRDRAGGRFRSGRGEPKRCSTQDEFIRPDTTLEVLAQAQARVPHRRQGQRDGRQLVGAQRRRVRAARRVRERARDELGVEPLARIVATAVAGVEPRIMGHGPGARDAQGPRARRAHARRRSTSSS